MQYEKQMEEGFLDFWRKLRNKEHCSYIDSKIDFIDIIYIQQKQGHIIMDYDFINV